MYAEERQHEIADLAHARGRVSVAELALQFEVTSETIRRDLDGLAARGLVSRVHGGAIPVERTRLVESGVSAREAEKATEKQRIAEAAMVFLPRGEDVTVLLDAGTTVGRLADLLPPGRVTTVVTNCLHTAAAISAGNRAEVQFVGGRVRGITQAAVGSATVDALREMRVDVAFVGANGFTAEHGFSTPDPAEGAVKRAMVGCARRVVVLADSSKFGSEYLVSFAKVTDVDVLITDRSFSSSARQSLIEQGIEVVLA
jgi:DeoR family transcriptional regulator, fructose operon transcriptional repressor